MIRVRRSEAGDAQALAPQLRKEDLREIQSLNWTNPEAALQVWIASSTLCYSATDPDGEVLGILGVIADREAHRVGMIWLLGSSKLVQHQITFLRMSRAWLSELHHQFPVLWNYIDARNTVHLAWLRWLGFQIIRPVKRGIHGEVFLEFRRTENPASEHAR